MVNTKLPITLKPSFNASSSNKTVRLSSEHEGFTLIEMMVVMVVLSILAGVMTLSVNTSDSQKNRAFYEHLIDSLSYVRLVSSEQMQPMGLLMQPDNQGQVQPVIVQLTNPFSHLESHSIGAGQQTKNSMQLSEAIMTDSDNQGGIETPAWVVAENIELPTLPTGVTIEVSTLEVMSENANGLTTTSSSSDSSLQPWFIGTDVPQALWYGNGEASPSRIEIRYNDRLVGDAITLMPDGSIGVED